MILNLRFQNAYVFSNEVVLSLEANMQTKKFHSNVYSENNFNVVKSMGLYGQNNVGKTKFIQCIKIIKSVMLNEKFDILPNWFNNDNFSKFGISFMLNGRKYDFEFKINAKTRNIIYEYFSEIVKDEYGNEKVNCLLKRDLKNNIFKCLDNELINILPFTANNNILIYLLDSSKFETLKFIKETIIKFAKKIDIIDMNHPPISNTISILKSHSKLQNKVVEFIKNADLYLEDYKYDENIQLIMSTQQKERNDLLNKEINLIPTAAMEQLKLVSVYKGIPVPSLLFDSIGTKKIVAIAGFIINALEDNRILIIDEMDSSLHFKLTRSIVSMFNNELNKNAQLIFTVHDINLLDLKKLFRKEQIAFMSKDDNSVRIYRLSDFKASDGIRDTTDIIEKYKKGILGAIPHPNLYKSLWSIFDDKQA